MHFFICIQFVTKCFIVKNANQLDLEVSSKRQRSGPSHEAQYLDEVDRSGPSHEAQYLDEVEPEIMAPVVNQEELVETRRDDKDVNRSGLVSVKGMTPEQAHDIRHAIPEANNNYQKFVDIQDRIKKGKIEKGDREYIRSFLSENNISGFKEDAYDYDVDGKKVSIRWNPNLGVMEGFIGGTDFNRGWFHGSDWAQNVAESGVFDSTGVEAKVISQHESQGFVDDVDKLFKEHGVKVVYGHSRGGALASYLPDEYIVVGIDGAAAIGKHREYMNIVGKNQLFDRAIAAGHKGNIGLSGVQFHDVTTDKPKKVKRERTVTPSTMDRSWMQKKKKKSSYHASAMEMQMVMNEMEDGWNFDEIDI